jgi:Flp pilus assembly protein TadB
LAAGLIIGLFLFFRNDIRAAVERYFKKAKHPPTIKDMVDEARGTRGNFIQMRFRQLYDLLEVADKEDAYERYCGICGMLAIAGALAALLIGNLFLIPVAALIGLFVPVLYLQVTVIGHIRHDQREIQTALSIVTSSYERTGNLYRAIKENIEYIHEPVKSEFEWFIQQKEFITPDVKNLLNEMKHHFKNMIWREWCEAMMICQQNSSKRNILNPIVDKLRNIELVQIKLDAMMYRPVKEFATLGVISFSIYPMIYFMNHAWFSVLVDTIPGKLAITASCGALLYALNALMKAVKPLEYTR